MATGGVAAGRSAPRLGPDCQNWPCSRIRYEPDQQRQTGDQAGGAQTGKRHHPLTTTIPLARNQATASLIAGRTGRGA